MSKGWLLVFLAGIAEIGFVLCLKLCEGFTKWVPTVGVALTGLISFGLLSQALRLLPAGPCYAAWTGIGAAGATALGFIVFKEPVSAAKILCIAMILGGIMGLKILSPSSH
jgi:quaternary ammonium compound-resistance protein SugE